MSRNLRFLGRRSGSPSMMDAGAMPLRTPEEIRSRQGVTRITARLSDEVAPGVLFTSFHFPEVAINQLTSGIFDIDSMTPEFKVVAVDVAAL